MHVNGLLSIRQTQTKIKVRSELGQLFAFPVPCTHCAHMFVNKEVVLYLREGLCFPAPYLKHGNYGNCSERSIEQGE